MKKLLVLSIALFTLFSCSSEDPIDPIIGSWTLFSEYGEEVDDCEKMSSAIFNENNTLSDSAYYTDSDNTCKIDGESTGIWSNKGNNIYSVKINSEEGEEEREEADAEVIFSNNNNTLTITSYNTDGTIDDTSVYNRVN